MYELKKTKKVFCFLCAGIICSFLFLACNKESGISVGMTQNKFGDKWEVSYKTSSEVLSEKINVQEEEDRILYVTGSCESGYLELQLSQGDTQKTYDISNQTDELKINLNEFEKGTVKVVLDNKEAKNVKFKSYWE